MILPAGKASANTGIAGKAGTGSIVSAEGSRCLPAITL
jgi:hypothetical protein